MAQVSDKEEKEVIEDPVSEEQVDEEDIEEGDAEGEDAMEEFFSFLEEASKRLKAWTRFFQELSIETSNDTNHEQTDGNDREEVDDSHHDDNNEEVDEPYNSGNNEEVDMDHDDNNEVNDHQTV